MKKISFFLLLISLSVSSPQVHAAAETPVIKKSKTNLYTELVDQSVFYELTSYLRMDRLYRKIFNKKSHAQDINVYDQVPDSAFFQNRHARKRLTAEELTEGYQENEGPSPEGELTVIKGKAEGLHPGFFIKDSRGDAYLLKFDPIQNLELNSSAEVISSRFYHAVGYNVPQYTIFNFDADRLRPADGAKITDQSGFSKPMTQEVLDEFLVYLPRTENGALRASASKLLKGENKGDFKFDGRRKDDPDDKIRHEKMRSLRALAVFGAMINNNDVRRQNTLDMLVTENGRTFLKHYLIDFNSTLGAAAGGPKPPMFTHEYFIDYGEITKNIATLGFRESTWQKRWRENSKKENDSFAQGYLDNNRFTAKDYKVQLPHYVFKDMTRADGYWAAKIIKTFTDEDLRALIKAGQYTEESDAEFIFTIISQRRELIARHWFSQASPLENFALENGKLSFKDLEIEHGYEKDGIYLLEAFSSGRKKSLGELKSEKSSFDLPSDWLNSGVLTLIIRTKRDAENKLRPFVLVEIQENRITKVLHQD